jgi:hypothetical protein
VTVDSRAATDILYACHPVFGAWGTESDVRVYIGDGRTGIEIFQEGLSVGRPCAQLAEER